MSRTWNFTKKDEINAANTKALQAFAGNTVAVKGIALTKGVDNETGEVRDVCLLKTDDGIVSSISQTVLRMIPKVIEYVEEEDLEEVEIAVVQGVSKEGKEFIMIRLV